MRVLAALLMLVVPVFADTTSPVETPGSAQATLRLRNGDVLQGELIGWTGTNSLVWKNPAMGSLTIPLANVAQVKFSKPEPNPPSSADPWMVSLANGDRLPGDPVGLTAEALTLNTSYAGQLKIPRERIRSIALITSAGKIVSSNSAEASLFLKNGDQLSGKLETISDATAQLKTAYSLLKVPLEKIQAIELPVTSSPLPDRDPAELTATLQNGGQMALKIESWTNGEARVVGASFGRATFTTTIFKSLQAGKDYTLKIRVFMDGSDRLHLRDQRLWFTHENWKRPGYSDGGTIEPTYVGDVKWEPEWTENTSKEFVVESTRIPNTDPYRAKIELIKARGKVEVSQQPTAANQYETIILIDDSDIPAQDWYEFIIRWTPGD